MCTQLVYLAWFFPYISPELCLILMYIKLKKSCSSILCIFEVLYFVQYYILHQSNQKLYFILYYLTKDVLHFYVLQNSCTLFYSTSLELCFNFMYFRAVLLSLLPHQSCASIVLWKSCTLYFVLQYFTKAVLHFYVLQKSCTLFYSTSTELCFNFMYFRAVLLSLVLHQS